LNFLDRFSKNPQISNFTQIRPVGAQLFHTDAHTDVAKLTVTFSHFANMPKNVQQQPLETNNTFITKVRIFTRQIEGCEPFFQRNPIKLSISKEQKPLFMKCTIF